MSRKSDNAATEVLEEIQSVADRMAEWIGSNPALVLGTAIGVLVIAAGYGFVTNLRSSAEERASAALAQVGADYRRAMGASPDAFEIAEPANPETAKEARTTALAAYQELAAEYAGSSVGSLAALEAGDLQTALGQPDQALETWRAAADRADRKSIPRALLLNRIGAEYEAEQHWKEAADAYESASDITEYPLRYDAMLAAARCRAAAGDAASAVALFERVENEAENVRIPDYVRAQMMELRAASEERAAG